MHKKGKERQNPILVVCEGYEESYLLEYLAENSKVKLNLMPCNGGTADSIVITAIKHSARGCEVYAFFDEDFEQRPNAQIADETLESLVRLWGVKTTGLKVRPYGKLQNINKNKKNPILIVSNPNSIEGLILQVYGIPLKTLVGKTTKQLKNDLDSLIDKCVLTEEDKERILFFDEKLSKYGHEMQHASSNEEKRHFQSKSNEWNRKKSKVRFMRFLHEFLPIAKISSMRTSVPVIDILLNAFQL